MTITELFTVILLVAGCFFFLAGTLGVLRFPDLFTRLHALTKADNLGLGFIAAGMALHIASPWAAIKIFSIWLFTLLASSTSCYLIARFQKEKNPPKNRKEEG
ncbi:cation:proton antiporter [Marinilabilia rubra]|uniref:Na+/H+ antiporter subunit G n=1 Tax=Marinilabilia rubra TaxID=2162893 RepID=A0A2U2B951_9BACT|nr:monovalent cation/H(+) antiporter subunit G [Marinilabilia rubra]PWD99587.1 Na+/H+ antiporter subunit G [Marinilabilia rubra]